MTPDLEQLITHQGATAAADKWDQILTWSAIYLTPHTAAAVAPIRKFTIRAQKMRKERKVGAVSAPLAKFAEINIYPLLLVSS